MIQKAMAKITIPIRANTSDCNTRLPSCSIGTTVEPRLFFTNASLSNIICLHGSRNAKSGTSDIRLGLVRQQVTLRGTAFLVPSQGMTTPRRVELPRAQSRSKLYLTSD